jgi:undecaprenyl phosphate N,N'-diacetylbacillosamine 1-phosphate transferase
VTITVDVDRRQVSCSLWARYLKRAVDILLSACVAVVAVPILAVAALFMQITSPGPVLFRQLRTGRRGRTFTPYKLRTMSAAHRHDPTEIVPLHHPGVTWVGRLLRRFKIDELPQVFNVLKGDMALVGPRPTIPEQTEAYDDFQRRRLLVRPGVTGLAQVNGNASFSWDERIKYDVYYVRHHNFVMDVGILIKTVAVLVLGEERFVRPFDQSPYASESAS